MASERNPESGAHRHDPSRGLSVRDVSLVFCDVVHFTEMTEALGDRSAHEVMTRYYRIVRGEVARCRGDELELRGDGFLLSFPDAESAVRCAIGIQRVLGDTRGPLLPIRVRMGVHSGRAIREGGSYFGRTVIAAARIAAAAQPDEILVSARVRAALRECHALHFGRSRELILKGFQRSHRVSCVLWSRRPPLSRWVARLGTTRGQGTRPAAARPVTAEVASAAGLRALGTHARHFLGRAAAAAQRAAPL